MLTELENKAGGKTASTSGDGVRTTEWSIGTLKNEGEISGGRHSVSALTVVLSNSGDITGGTSSAGSGDKAALMCWFSMNWIFLVHG